MRLTNLVFLFGTIVNDTVFVDDHCCENMKIYKDKEEREKNQDF